MQLTELSKHIHINIQSCSLCGGCCLCDGDLFELLFLLFSCWSALLWATNVFDRFCFFPQHDVACCAWWWKPIKWLLVMKRYDWVRLEGHAELIVFGSNCCKCYNVNSWTDRIWTDWLKQMCLMNTKLKSVVINKPKISVHVEPFRNLDRQSLLQMLHPPLSAQSMCKGSAALSCTRTTLTPTQPPTQTCLGKHTDCSAPSKHMHAETPT